MCRSRARKRVWMRLDTHRNRVVVLREIAVTTGWTGEEGSMRSTYDRERDSRIVYSRGVPRRDFLAALAAAGVSASLPDFKLAAQTKAAAASAAFRVDVHYHFSSPGFIAAIKARNTGQAALMQWTPEKALEDMDKDGVATSMVSTSEPSVWFGDDAAARKLARECNEYGARLVA